MRSSRHKNFLETHWLTGNVSERVFNGMANRSKKFYFFTTLLGLALLWMLAGLLKSGGIDRGFATDPSYFWAADMEGVQCQTKTIPVKLSADGFRQFDLVGQLCSIGDPQNKTLQVLVSGSGYGFVYWDFPFQSDTYSYARAALRAGDAVFNFDRLGMGLSDHPFGVSLDVDTQAYVLHQTLDAITAE